MDVPAHIEHAMVDFMAAVDQLRHEHEELKTQLIELESAWLEVTVTDPHNKAAAIDTVAQAAEAYLRTLHTHASWEDGVLFPMVTMYFVNHAEQVQTIEADHEEAEHDLRTFITLARQVVNPVEHEHEQAMGLKLLHACRVLNRHFTAEEEIVFPLAEFILEDIDYMSL
jgi:iron-sulfur cluster repair protein YtfE (RIC family)